MPKSVAPSSRRARESRSDTPDDHTLDEHTLDEHPSDGYTSDGHADDDPGEKPDAAARGGVAESGPDMTPLDGDDFLAANRRERERLRADADRKAVRSSDPDRIPRKIDDSTPPSSTGRSRRRLQIAGSRRLFALVAVLVALVIGLGVATGVLAYQLGQTDNAAQSGPSENDRREVIEVAKRSAATVATYDSTNYGDLDSRVRAVSTPEFFKGFLTSSHDARTGNASAKGVSKAVADHAGIESMSDANAKVLISLDQTITSTEVANQVPQGIPYQSRVLVTLTKQNGRWLLAKLDVID
ncbi:hypothetical protein ACLQ3C_03830 [Gordonia sp. DT30]|uniref:hypothetical protein n=1 Tax=unclassified Gordonia (in: high G+C Gram-positive bacteria) TaxID=2657482 RepID=UPI003CED257E